MDFLRGIAAVAVILGHTTNLNYGNMFLFRFISLWNMPLFMLLSGFTLGLSNNRSI